MFAKKVKENMNDPAPFCLKYESILSTVPKYFLKKKEPNRLDKFGLNESAIFNGENLLIIRVFCLLLLSWCSTTGKPTRSFATERVSLDSV